MHPVLATLLAAAAPALGLVNPDGTGRLPALGWNSWNEYACDINETVFLRVGQLMIDLGLKDRGYEYVNIDDCWSNKELRRDNITQQIIPDYEKFPNGIKGLADKIHDMGLKLGIYGDAGTSTCGGYAGSIGYEDVDAATFAAWGVDCKLMPRHQDKTVVVEFEQLTGWAGTDLKYDNCNVPEEWYDLWKYAPELWFGGGQAESQDNGDPGSSVTGEPAPAGYDWSTSNTAKRYDLMRDALLGQNRTIQYSLCAWGHSHVEQWGNDTGHSWRMWGDIYPEWDGHYQWSWGLMPILNHASFFYNTTNFWGHNDWDMLEVGNGNLTLEESRSHFAFWSGLKSPLIIGTKLDGIDDEILDILANKELVEFNQDPAYGEGIKPYKWGINPDGTWNQTHPAEFWCGESVKGTHLYVLNTLNATTRKTVDFDEVPGLSGRKTYKVHDMWTGRDLGMAKGKYSMKVKAHDTAALRIEECRGRRCH
ncbi:hypothetical protein MKZ38_004470 [Zalerion maritima]|uniref:Alpha-galactosidase n=1 Tax=Zalerion maritima TaxID=339359 RepID=A0AAD5RL92_9PEZI|nr:hypothetical protein MKZ38_004470 [Zalerion maritima]